MSSYVTLDDLIEDLLFIFGNLEHSARWEPIERRARVLFGCAKEVSSGVIVELGTYRGYGAFSLAYGALAGNRQAVYTVDDYAPRTGWAGEEYRPEDEEVFSRNRAMLSFGDKINLTHVRKSAEEAARHISGIGLLFVDLSPSMPNVVDVWCDSVLQGGLILFRDTLTRSLGYDKAMRAAIVSGKWDDVAMQDQYFLCIRKK